MNEMTSSIPSIDEIFTPSLLEKKFKSGASVINYEFYQSIMSTIASIRKMFRESSDYGMLGKEVYEVTDTLLCLRHDIAHVILATELGVVAMEKPMRMILKEQLDYNDHQLTNQIFNKTPDIVLVDKFHKKMHLADVAVSVAASLVHGFKNRKYMPLVEELQKLFTETGNSFWRVEFSAIVLDQSLSNIDMILSPFDTSMIDKRKQILRILISECNQLIGDFERTKLSNDPLQRNIFYELRAQKTTSDVGYAVHPLPDESTISEIESNEFIKRASKPFEPRYKDNMYAQKICDEFLKVYDEKKFRENRIFEYPSPEEIDKSFEIMEGMAESEYKLLSKPKPSLHFMLALTQRSQTQHDGKLDLFNIELLRNEVISGMYSINRNEFSANMHEMLTDIFCAVPNLTQESKEQQIWVGKNQPEKMNDNIIVKGRATISSKTIKQSKNFLRQFLGIGKESEKSVDDVKSLAFWETKVREESVKKMADLSLLLSTKRRDEKLRKPFLTGITSVDKLNQAQHEEIQPIYDFLQNTQASYLSKQISEMTSSMLIQRKREANNIQILNKGDRGFFVITFQHRLLETKKTGNTVPFINICLRKENEKTFNAEILCCSFKTKNGYIIDVSYGMRLDTNRIESLSHSYELLNSVLTGWFVSTNTKLTDVNEMQLHYNAIGYLFMLCHSVHLRTGGLLDNLRYMFMDVTAEKSNFRMFMQDNGKIALKNTVQVALYSKMRDTLPKYSKAASMIKTKQPSYDKETNEMAWGSLGVTGVSIPSLISPGYNFESFMAATNEIVGLFFAVPKDLHGAFHKMVYLEKTPFEWQRKFKDKEYKNEIFLDWFKTKEAINKGQSKSQTVDLNYVFEVGRHVNEKFLKPRRNELLKELSKLRMNDSILSHKQFTSSKSCIHKIDAEGYAVRNKVLLITLELIDKVFNGVAPTLWEFCIWAITTDEPFRFVISPKGQRTMTDREIYIGNIISFCLRLVEKIFAAICKFQSNDALHVSGDRKFIEIQDKFRNILNWSKQQTENKREKGLADEKIKELIKSQSVRDEFKEKVKATLSWAERCELDQSKNITNQEQEIIDSMVAPMIGMQIKHREMKDNIERSSEVAEIQKWREIKSLRNTTPNIVFLNGDRTKWSAADVCEKFTVYIDALDIIPKHIRTLCKAILFKHDEKLMHISPSLHQKYLSLEMKDNPFIDVCGVESCGKIKGNWFQGMLNFLSSSFHAGSQDLSWECLKTRILPRIPIELSGLCHSDDEVAFIGFGTIDDKEEYENENVFHKNPLETILHFHNLMGSLGSMNYSQKKTNIHYKVSEFVSLFLIWGDQQFPFMKHLATAISGLPGTGLDDDMYSALSQIMMASVRGCPLSTLPPIIQLAQERIDRMYSLGKGMTNDVETILKIPRQYLPLELGGHFLPGPLPLMLAGPAVHDICAIKTALEGKFPEEGMNEKVLKCYYALTPHGLIKAVADDDPLAQEEQYASTKLSGFQGMIFKNYLPKKGNELLEKFANQISKDDETEFMIKRPTASVIKPSDGADALTYWKMVISKPAWIRAVRKEGARGMAIKRAQWVKGEQVKLKYTDDWSTIQSCLTSISEYVNSDEEFTYEARKIMSDYVYNVSSSTCCILDYLSRINVNKTDKMIESIKLAVPLNKPSAYRDIKNDVRKVIAFTFDEKSFHKEGLTVKFSDFLKEDVAKIKTFYKPTLESTDKSSEMLIRLYKFCRTRVLDGWKLKQSLETAKQFLMIDDKTMDEFPSFVQNVYAESSWVYKQFEDNLKTRIVITSALDRGLSPVEKIIKYNALRWGSFTVTTGVSMIKTQPTANADDYQVKGMKIRSYIDTMVHLYRNLLNTGVGIQKIREIFQYVGMTTDGDKFETLRQILRNCNHYVLTTDEVEYPQQKAVAIMSANILMDKDAARKIMSGYSRPLGSWTKSQFHVGGGRYVGDFEYTCWIGENNLKVSGSDIDNAQTQRWILTTRESNVATSLIAKAYYEIFKTSNYMFEKLKPEYLASSITNIMLCRVGSTWSLIRPGPGVRALTKVEVHDLPLKSQDIMEEAIYCHKSGLSIWQKSKYTKEISKMITLKRTNTSQQMCDRIINKPGSRHRLMVDNVNLGKLIDSRMLPSLLSRGIASLDLKRLLNVIECNEVQSSRTKQLWDIICHSMHDQFMPPMPQMTFKTKSSEFPALTYEEINSANFMDKCIKAESLGDIFDLISEADEDEITQEIIDSMEDSDLVLSSLEHMSEYQRHRYLESMHRKKKMTEDHSYDPEIFKGTRIELYHEGSDPLSEECEVKSFSSGSSEVTIKETLQTLPGTNLGEKLIAGSLSLDSSDSPMWDEIVVYILKEVTGFGKIAILKSENEGLNKSTLLAWEMLCDHVLTFGLPSSDAILFDTELRKQALSETWNRIERSSPRKIFESYNDSIFRELIDETYIVKSEISSYFAF